MSWTRTTENSYRRICPDVTEVLLMVYDDDRRGRRTGRIGRRHSKRRIDRETLERILELLDQDPSMTAYDIATVMVDEGFEINEETVEAVLEELAEEA
jgi:hypothetical protein